jgi:hypothetical protein
MGYVYALASGLVFLIMGIAFLWNRILYIKKGNIALATMFKREEYGDDDNDTRYIPYFKFMTYYNKEIIYKHSSTQSKYFWTIGEQVKVVYRKSRLDNHEILLLTFFNAFGLSMTLLTVGIELLLISVAVYWNVPGKTLCYLTLVSACIFIAGFNVWANRFFNALIIPDSTH